MSILLNPKFRYFLLMITCVCAVIAYPSSKLSPIFNIKGKTLSPILCLSATGEAEIMERKEFSAAPTYDSHPFSSTNKKSINKARFSDDQIRSLESIFKAETKLEPRKKMEVAGQLGLQPRQVAIWFQNRRARWKSKQIEQDLRILRANYDSLSSKFETLQEEKKVLLSQLQKLSDLLDKPRSSSTTNGEEAEEKARNKVQEELEEAGTAHSYEYQNVGIIRRVEDERCEFEVSNPEEEQRNCINYDEEDGRQLWNLSEQLHASLLTSPSFENSCCSSEWLNFWS